MNANKNTSLTRRVLALAAAAAALTLTALTALPARADTTLLNVSYEPTRERYQAFNAAFAESWKAKTGETVTVRQSHGGSGKQARSVIDGLEADVVTLALACDIDAIHDNGKQIPADWQKRMPSNASPYTSTVVFLVARATEEDHRPGRPGPHRRRRITPNPEASGGARCNDLAAWGCALEQPGGNAESAKNFVERLCANTKLLDSGACGSTTPFVARGIGDVRIAWESEACLSVLAEPPVSVVDKNVDKRGTRKILRFGGKAARGREPGAPGRLSPLGGSG